MITELDLKDRFSFGLYFLQDKLHVRCSPMHQEIARFPALHKRVAIIGFRLGAKSVWGTLNTAIFEATEEPTAVIRISSNTAQWAEELLRQIRIELTENRFLLEQYPWLAKKWPKLNADELVTPLGTRILARGYMHLKRGDHPDREIIDDPEDKLEVRSETNRESFVQQWGAVEGSWKPETKVLFIANYTHPLCFAKKLYENNFDSSTGIDVSDWSRIKYESGYHEAAPIWPAMWPMEKLEEKRKSMGWQAFDAEFENRPEFFLEPVIKPEWFKKYKPGQITTVALRTATYWITYDAAFSLKDSADFWAAGLWAKLFEGELKGKTVLLKHVNNKALVDDNVRAMLGWVSEYGGRPAIVHNKAEGKDYLIVRQTVDRLMQQERMNCFQYEIEREAFPGDKRARMMSVSGEFQAGEVYFSETGSQPIIEQILMLGEADYDDYADMVSTGVHYGKTVFPPQPKRLVEEPALSYLTVRRPEEVHRNVLSGEYEIGRPL